MIRLAAVFLLQRAFLFPNPQTVRTAPATAGFPQAEEHHDETAGIIDGNDDQQPFQDGHQSRSLVTPYIALTMLSVTFLASPSSIMVLSR